MSYPHPWKKAVKKTAPKAGGKAVPNKVVKKPRASKPAGVPAELLITSPAPVVPEAPPVALPPKAPRKPRAAKPKPAPEAPAATETPVWSSPELDPAPVEGHGTGHETEVGAPDHDMLDHDQR